MTPEEQKQLELEQEQNKEQKPDNIAMIQLKQKLSDQAAQVLELQQQLQQSKNVEQTKAQEKAEAEALKLAEEADLKHALGSLENDKYESLTNKELIDIVASAVELSADARSKQNAKVLEDKMAVINNQVTNTQKAVMQIATAMDIKETRSQHSDFDEFQQEAAVIMQDIPGLTVQDAYRLAKARKVEVAPAKENVDRERPNTTVSRSAVDQAAEISERRSRQTTSASTRSTKKVSGVKGFRDLIDAGIDAVQARRG